MSQERRQEWITTLIISAGIALIPLNGVFIASSYSVIASDFGISFATSSILSIFHLAFTMAMQPLAGAIGDIAGRKRIFLLGLLGFALVSAIASTAQSFYQLIVYRSLLALLAAIIMPNGIALLKSALNAERMGFHLGLMAALSTLAGAIGFPIGTWLIGQSSWQALFWINVPLALITALLAFQQLKESQTPNHKIPPLAWGGMPLVPVILGVNIHNHLYPVPWLTPLAISLTLIVSVIVSWYILRTQESRQELGRFQRRGFWLALGMVGLLNLAIYAVFLIMPTWLMSSLHTSHQTASNYMALVIFSMAVGAPLTGMLIDKYGSRQPFLLASVGLASALLGLSLIEVDLVQSLLTAILILLGLSVGNIGTVAQHAALQASPRYAAALAMGLFSSNRYLWGIVGTAIVGLLISNDTVVNTSEGITVIRWVLIGTALPLFLLSFFLEKKPTQ